MTSDSDRNADNKRLIFKLVLMLLGSVLFAIAMVPLYNVLCDVTGFNGKTKNSAELVEKSLKVDNTRWVKIEFTSNVMSGLSWEFAPMQSSMVVHPGQLELAKYVAKNITDQDSTGQAIPSITPGQAAQYFRKIECFCFRHQDL